MKCNCAHNAMPLEWSRYSLTWVHRHPTLDHRCMNPPFEYRLVRKDSGEVVTLRPGERPQDWYETFPHLYRLERRLFVPWADAHNVPSDVANTLEQSERTASAAGEKQNTLPQQSDSCKEMR